MRPRDPGAPSREEATHHGLVTVDRARVWSLPSTPPPIFGAAVSEETARTVGARGDGLMTVYRPIHELRRVLDAFRDAGGHGKRTCVQVHVSWAPTNDEALAIAHDQWRTNVFGSELAWNLELPSQFDAAAKFVRPRDVREVVLVSSDLERHAAWLQEIAELGVDEISIHHVGQEQGPVHRRVRRARPPESDDMTTARTSDLWWKNAVIYCLDVETFLDWDGDGFGDLRGLTERVDYLAGIGISCLWLMPFQPSPNRDDGYDITDFYGVDPRLGSLETSCR